MHTAFCIFQDGCSLTLPRRGPLPRHHDVRCPPFSMTSRARFRWLLPSASKAPQALRACDCRRRPPNRQPWMEKRHVKQFRVPSGGTLPPGSLREVPQVASRYLSPPRVHPTLAFDLRTYGLRRFTSPCLRGPPGSSKRKNAKKANGFGNAPPHCS